MLKVLSYLRGSPGLIILLAISIFSVVRLSSIAVQQQTAAQAASGESKISDTTSDIANLLAQVGSLIVLPQNETPTVATVNNPEALKEQPFFAGAKQGHKVLIYTKAQKAILYDPTAHKIVEVAPINLGDVNK